MTKTGTFKCWLFGHKFMGRKRVYEPHYLKLAEQGLATTCQPIYDFHMINYQTDHCTRCGLEKQ